MVHTWAPLLPFLNNVCVEVYGCARMYVFACVCMCYAHMYMYEESRGQLHCIVSHVLHHILFIYYFIYLGFFFSF